MYLKNTSQRSPSNLTEMQDLMVIKNKVLPGMRKCAAFSADSIFSCMQNAKKTQVRSSRAFKFKERAENLGKITSKLFSESVRVGRHDPGNGQSQLQELACLGLWRVHCFKRLCT